jgi:bifunctional DNA-binding transcriptional regulator/antitoxin component of YhaV-PrlF toxin-antitoxin module
MAKVTSKLQLTLPKALAERYGVEPGDEVEWEAAGDAIRVVPSSTRRRRDASSRLRLFDAATRRQEGRQEGAPSAIDRGWTREELYERRPR